MYNLLSGLKVYLKRQEIVTDNPVFRLHYMFTTVLLCTFSLIITANQFVGSPIDCIVDGLPRPIINTYCWISTTFTMPDAFRRQVGEEVAHPGVANDFGDESAKKYYTYYQWVCFVLFFQALLCYIPKWLWDCWEQDLMNNIVLGLNVGCQKAEEKDEKKKVLIDYLLRHIKQHNMYAFRYWFCEALSLANIIFQLYITNKFFDGEFLSYGLRVLHISEQNQDDRIDPMVFVFPKVTKCTFHKFGSSGTIQRHDTLCVLPLNIVNEKTYIFIWFWFIILATLLSIVVLYRAIILTVPSIRPRLLHLRHRLVPRDVAEAITRKTAIGDWWILYMLGRNVDPLVYREVMDELAKKIETAASNSPSS